MADKLKMDEINQLPGPLLVRLCGGDWWPMNDVDVETGLMRIDVCGLLDIKHFCEVMEIQDGDGVSHDPEDFWHN